MIAELAQQYHGRLLREDRVADLAASPPDRLRLAVESAVDAMLQEDRRLIARAEREQLVRMVADEVAGCGPLEPLLADDEVSEIMVNGPAAVFVERRGQIGPAGVAFRDEAHLYHCIQRIVARANRRIDESSPLVDARLTDGSRVHAALPPVSLQGPVLTIRKFRQRPPALAALVAWGSLTPQTAEFLVSAVQERRNILFAGGAGSGKTTLLSAVAAAVPAGERLITIEDMAELRLDHPHVVRLEARPANVEGRGEIRIRELVRNALRMRPDRILVGEVRGEEAFDMLQAMNTGHPGSMTTLHANSPADAFTRLEAMVAMSGTQLPPAAVRNHLLSALDLVVQTARLPDGHRVVIEVARVDRSPATGLQVVPLGRYDRQQRCYLLETEMVSWSVCQV